MKVRASEFVRIWQTSQTVEEVASKTGVGRDACYQRALKYRQNNVPLKKLPMTENTGTASLDYDELAKLAAEFNNATDE